MASARAVVVGLLVAVLGFGLARAAGQSDSPPVAWEKQLPKSIDWYVRTSTGVLLIRSGNMLHAVDGKDGRELWSMKGLDLGGPKQRGKNIAEIPGTPILLLKHRSSKPQIKGSLGSLLAVDLWKGTILWQENLDLDIERNRNRGSSSGIEDLDWVIPFYESGRVLLVNYSGPNYKPRLQLQHISNGKVEWRSKYPGPGPSTYVTWRRYNGQVYAYGVGIRSHEVGRLDLETGKRVWRFNQGSGSRDALVLGPKFTDGKILLGGKKLVALDAVSGEPVWTEERSGAFSAWVLGEEVIFAAGKRGVVALDVSSGAVQWWTEAGSIGAPAKLEKISSLSLVQGALLVTGEEGAFALDASSGALRWSVEMKGPLTEPTWFEEPNSLVFCNKSEMFVVDAGNGKVLRRATLDLKSKGHLLFIKRPSNRVPFLTRRVGQDLLLVNTGVRFSGVPFPFLSNIQTPTSALYDVRTGEKRWTENKVMSLSPVEIVRIFERQSKKMLREAWEMLKKRADQNPGWQAVLERLEPFVQEAEEGFQPAYLTSLPKTKDRWKLWQIDPSTGRQKEWSLTGIQPDFNPAFGLAYTFSGKNLQAFRLSGE